MPRKQRHSRRLRCLGYKINLSAKAFLYNKDFNAFKTNIENIREHLELLKKLVIVFICRLP